MPWEQEIVATPVDDLVARNSPELLAHQLATECQKNCDLVVRAARERQGLVERLTEDQRIGEADRDAARTGRKTLRVADLLPAPTRPPTTTALQLR